MTATPEFTPITPRTGGLTHAIRITERKTACNRVPNGWIVALVPLTCAICRNAILGIG